MRTLWKNFFPQCFQYCIFIKLTFFPYISATKQDADLTPESDQKQTQSDPTIGSTLITGPYQASSPIIPATEKAIVEDHLPGLPPKLPPKYTGTRSLFKNTFTWYHISSIT